ncbi:MAG TPA: hypothetical protein VNO26_03995 [Candidatus Limnocylindria bacterium]|nr:hypothetical protein [Candidatus Limnocylindria bacterium]
MASAQSSDSGPGVVDPDERFFWALMRRFETLAVDRYAALAPALLLDEKVRFVERLAADGADPAALAASPLEKPSGELLARAQQSRDEAATLLVQGIVLECLGQAIYRLVAGRTEGVSEASRQRAAEGLAASAAVTAAAGARIAERLGTGEPLYARFADVTYDVVAALDPLADPVDCVFGRRFGLRFADVMGEFTADLVGVCTGLGMQRRKVVAHLTGAAMGV